MPIQRFQHVRERTIQPLEVLRQHSVVVDVVVKHQSERPAAVQRPDRVQYSMHPREVVEQVYRAWHGGGKVEQDVRQEDHVRRMANDTLRYLRVRLDYIGVDYRWNVLLIKAGEDCRLEIRILCIVERDQMIYCGLIVIVVAFRLRIRVTDFLFSDVRLLLVADVVDVEAGIVRPLNVSEEILQYYVIRFREEWMDGA